MHLCTHAHTHKHISTHTRIYTHRLDKLLYPPSAVPPLGAWAQLTDLSNLEDMEVDPLHTGPLHASCCPHDEPSLRFAKEDIINGVTKGGARRLLHGGGGGLAACMRSNQDVNSHSHIRDHPRPQSHPQQLRPQQQQGCFQMRSGRYVNQTWVASVGIAGYTGRVC
jgi:hypothetical protein